MFEMTLITKLYVMVARMNRKQDCQTKKEKEREREREREKCINKESEREGDSERERTRKVRYPNMKSRA